MKGLRYTRIERNCAPLDVVRYLKDEPMLFDQSHWIARTNIITTYLDKRFPEPTLLVGDTALERAAFDMLVAHCAETKCVDGLPIDRNFVLGSIPSALDAWAYALSPENSAFTALIDRLFPETEVL